MSQSRQLAAIMFADIAGYTAMMQEDEVLALQLRHKLQKKLEDEVAIHQGRYWSSGVMAHYELRSDERFIALLKKINLLSA